MYFIYFFLLLKNDPINQNPVKMREILKRNQTPSMYADLPGPSSKLISNTNINKTNILMFRFFYEYAQLANNFFH